MSNEAFYKWAFAHEYAIDDYVYALEIWQAAQQQSAGEIAELQAHIEDLRKELLQASYELNFHAAKHIDELLASTPQQSLQNLIDAVREDDAKVCDEQQKEGECPERATYCADAIRALKGKPL